MRVRPLCSAALPLAVFLSMSLAACGGSDDTPTTPAASAAPAGTKATLAVLETTDLHTNVLSYDYFKLAALANFFEDLAILEKEGQITFDQVVDRFAPTITYYRGIYEGFITEKKKEDPEILKNFDSLSKRLKSVATP